MSRTVERNKLVHQMRDGVVAMLQCYFTLGSHIYVTDIECVGIPTIKFCKKTASSLVLASSFGTLARTTMGSNREPTIHFSPINSFVLSISECASLYQAAK